MAAFREPLSTGFGGILCTCYKWLPFILTLLWEVDTQIFGGLLKVTKLSADETETPTSFCFWLQGHILPLYWPKGASVISDARLEESDDSINRIPLWYDCPAVTPPKGLLLSVGPWPSHTESREDNLFSSLIHRFLCFQNGLPLPSAPYTSFVTNKCFSPNGVQRQYCPAKFQIQNDTLTHFSTNLVILSKQDICLCDTRCCYGTAPHAGPRLFSNFS